MAKIKNVIVPLLLTSLYAFAQVDYVDVEIPDAEAVSEKSTSTTTYSKSTGSTLSLGNHIWFDHNGNGIQDLGELGIYGVEVQLFNNANCTGSPIATTKSSDVGYYEFSNLSATTEKHCLGLVYPAHWTHTLTHEGDTFLDSDLVEMNAEMGKIPNILLTQTNNTLDAGLHHKDRSCQVPTLKEGTVGVYDNRKSWAKRGSLDVEFTDVSTSGFCHEYHDSGPERGEKYTVHLEDRRGFSDLQRDHLSRIFRYMSDPEVLLLLDNTFDDHGRDFWFNIVSNSFVWYYSDWGSDFSKIENYINNSSWSEKITDAEKESLIGIATTIINKIEGLNGEVQYEPMKVYYLWNEENSGHQDLIVPETSVVPKMEACSAPVNDAKLGDFVWFDADKNGQQDKGESGINGIKVELFDATDKLLKTTTTDANGAYGFGSLEAGEYRVKFTAKAGWSITTQTANGVPDTLNSDADAITGKTASVTLNDGDENLDTDAGLYITPKPSMTIVKKTNGGNVSNIVVGDTVTWSYVLTNTGNTPLVNIVINDDKEGAVSECQGDGSLESLNPKKSISCTKVGAAILGAYTNTATVVAHADDIELTATASSSYVGKEAPVELGSIGDYVWLDNNNNGQQDENELPLSGIGVKLFDTSGKELDSTKTNASGHYLFKEVPAGDYYLKFLKPSGYAVTKQDKGDDAKDSDADATGKTANFTLAAGESISTMDMGLYPMLIELGNRVWYDKNRNGIQDASERRENVADVGVKLYKEDGTFVAETKTRASGHYDFKDLLAGSYYVIFEIPDNYKVSPKNVGQNESDDSDADPVTGKTDLITLVAGIDNRMVDMGLYQEAAKVGDRVWYDANKNGLQDDGEDGVGGVVINLYRVGEAEAVATTTTASTGIYLFDNVAPSDYYIEFKAPAAYTITESNRGDDKKDSDADQNGRTENFTLFAGTKNSSIDMGVYQNVVSLGDKVWLDTNHDGIQDVGETGVRDINVTIHSETNDFSKSVLTDENGNYLFTHLAAGEYRVEFKDIPYGHLITEKDVNGNENDQNDSDVFVNDDEKLVTEATLLTPGENDLSWDLGIYKTVCLPGKAVLGNLVWEDFNKNGIQDIGERGVANVKATLYNNDTDEKVAEVVTDENGLYEFAHLDPAFNYYVQFTVPAGYVVSPQDQDDEIIDSDADENGKTDVISLEADQINSTVDMGIHHEGSTLGDRVWYDEKNGMSNGLQDEGENGVQDVTVTLYDRDAKQIATTQTNASGEYHFTNIPKGRYTIGFENLPDGYIFTSKDEGINEEADSDVNANGRTDLIVINGVHNLSHIDAGIRTLKGGEAGDDVQQGLSGQGVTIDVLGNDVEGSYAFDATSVKITSVPEGATLSEDGKTLTVPHEGVWSVDPITGAITFTPNDDFVGDPTAISYTVSDKEGNESGAEVEVNYPPVAVDDYVNGEVGKQIVVYVIDNDSNTSSPLDRASLRIIDPENNEAVETLSVDGEGTWSTNADGSITFTPEDAFESNPRPIEYTIREQLGDESNRARVIIVYPDAVDDVINVPMGEHGVLSLNVLENDSNNTISSLVSLSCVEAGVKRLPVAGEGVWSVDDAALLTFTPETGFEDEPSDINYTVGLVSNVQSNCANVDVRYELQAEDDSSTINVGMVTNIYILSNDYGSLNPESVQLLLPENVPAGSRVSGDGKSLSVRGEGMWSVNSDGLVTFRAEDGFTHNPTPINYTVENRNGMLSNIATITLTQGAVSTVTASSNEAQANGANPIIINVLSDDSGDLEGSTVYLLDANGSLVERRLVEGEGTWQVNADQTVTFTPQEGYRGTPSPVNYVIQDRNGDLSNRASITIVGACTCEAYESSVSSMSETSAMLMLLLTLLLTVFFFERDENYYS